MAQERAPGGDQPHGANHPRSLPDNPRRCRSGRKRAYPSGSSPGPPPGALHVATSGQAGENREGGGSPRDRKHWQPSGGVWLSEKDLFHRFFAFWLPPLITTIIHPLEQPISDPLIDMTGGILDKMAAQD